MPVYQCPTNPTPYDDNPEEFMRGCGHTFVEEPDEEGLVDCPNCGMWFSPAIEPHTVIQGEL